MINRKGMSMAMQIVIVLVVLVVLALIVIGVTRGQIFNSIFWVGKSGDIQQCQTERDVYCQSHQTGCWDGSEAAITKGDPPVSVSCNEILGLDADESSYHCEYSKYMHKDVEWVLNRTYNFDSLPEDEQKSNICREFGFYWGKDPTGNTQGTYCYNRNRKDAEEIDLTLLDSMRCGS